MAYRIFVPVSMCLVFVVLAFGEAENPLEKAEALMTDGKFYEALFALEPLLTTDEKSEDQEAALWLANALCKTWVNSGDFDKKWKEDIQAKKESGLPYSDWFMDWDKVTTLNAWGARIEYMHFAAAAGYQYGFLKRLVTLYPESSWRPAAEYYLIEDGNNERESVEKSLNAHYAYIKKYAKSGLTEVYMAYLRIAHIHDNLWQLLKTPSGTPHDFSIGFISGDPEKDNEDAMKHKAEALKYYAKFIVSVGGHSYHGGFSRQYQTAVERFEDLKQDKEWHNFIILMD